MTIGVLIFTTPLLVKSMVQMIFHISRRGQLMRAATKVEVVLPKAPRRQIISAWNSLYMYLIMNIYLA